MDTNRKKAAGLATTAPSENHDSRIDHITQATTIADAARHGCARLARARRCHRDLIDEELSDALDRATEWLAIVAHLATEREM